MIEISSFATWFLIQEEFASIISKIEVAKEQTTTNDIQQQVICSIAGRKLRDLWGFNKDYKPMISREVL